jgi:hypothetical protein
MLLFKLVQCERERRYFNNFTVNRSYSQAPLRSSRDARMWRARSSLQQVASKCAISGAQSDDTTIHPLTW